MICAAEDGEKEQTYRRIDWKAESNHLMITDEC